MSFRDYSIFYLVREKLGEKKPDRDVIAMFTDLAAVRKRVHKLILVRDLATFNKLEQMQYVRMLKRQATRTQEDSFDRIKVMAEKQRRTLELLCSEHDPEHFQIGKH